MPKKNTKTKVVVPLKQLAPAVWSPVDVDHQRTENIVNEHTYEELKQVAICLGIDEHVSKGNLAICVQVKKNVFFPNEVQSYLRRTLLHFVQQFTCQAPDRDNISKTQLQNILLEAWKGGDDGMETTILHISHVSDLVQNMETQFCSDRVKELLRTPSKSGGMSLHESVNQHMVKALSTIREWKAQTNPCRRRELRATIAQRKEKLDVSAQKYMGFIRKHCEQVTNHCNKDKIPESVKMWAAASPLRDKSIVCSVRLHGKKVRFRRGDVLANGFTVGISANDTEGLTWLGIGQLAVPTPPEPIQPKVPSDPIPEPLRMDNMLDLYDSASARGVSFLSSAPPVQRPPSEKQQQDSRKSSFETHQSHRQNGRDQYTADVFKMVKKAIVQGGNLVKRTAVSMAMAALEMQLHNAYDNDWAQSELYFRSYRDPVTGAFSWSAGDTPQTDNMPNAYEAICPPGAESCDHLPPEPQGSEVKNQPSFTTAGPIVHYTDDVPPETTTTNPFLPTDSTSMSAFGSTQMVVTDSTQLPFNSPLIELERTTTGSLPVVPFVSALPQVGLETPVWAWFPELLYNTNTLPTEMVEDALQLQIDTAGPVCVDISDLITKVPQLKAQVDSGQISSWTTVHSLPSERRQSQS